MSPPPPPISNPHPKGGYWQFQGEGEGLYQLNISQDYHQTVWNQGHLCSNPKTEVYRFKDKLVRVNATVNFAHIVKRATCLMAKTQYNSNNSLTSEFK